MPKSRHRPKPPRKPPAAPPPPRPQDDDDAPRPRNKVQTIGALIMVLILAFSILISVALPFLTPR